MIVCGIFLKLPSTEKYSFVLQEGLYNTTIGIKLKIVTGKEKKFRMVKTGNQFYYP